MHVHARTGSGDVGFLVKNEVCLLFDIKIL